MENASDSTYRDDMSMGDALWLYFKRNGFGIESYTAPTFPLTVKGWTVTLPNPEARRKAIRVHDLIHIVTEFPTTTRGETQVGAYELGAGLGSYPAAWFFDCNSLALGLALQPLITMRAFANGKASAGSLYHLLPPENGEGVFSMLYELSVGKVRKDFRVIKDSKAQLKHLPEMLCYATIGLSLTPFIFLSFLHAIFTTLKRA